ncbi:DNA polymerase III subunit delta' [Pseudoalteromonas sp. J010]|uniref:DNA polymerase III subunit delta' n=1 Tax=Pseudoalteromonas sp. J010 TaxID=998465 RepID=UPI000F64AFF3|nr:DNA polymerase III subunit delta' [Pseudoalteromonas sp. J010]RRS09652.1 DNA polymerase III subunit delta' [Pseudoalteromonas sp. J010]
MLASWHHTPLNQLARAQQAGRLHHAHLLSGKKGVGKGVLARHLANALLCNRAETLTACGNCKACSLNLAGSHPDKLIVAPDGKSIGVDEIRDITNFLNHSAQQGGSKVALIEQAHLMTHSAANALLKTLEEPNFNRYLLITSDDDSKLPATVLSRCNKVTIHSPSLTEAAKWLAEHDLGSNLPWIQEFSLQPFVISGWQKEGLIDEVTQLFNAANKLDGESALQVEKILLKHTSLSDVFARFLLSRVKSAMLSEAGLSFTQYQALLNLIHRFMYEQKNVLGLNQSLSISNLLFALQKQL